MHLHRVHLCRSVDIPFRPPQEAQEPLVFRQNEALMKHQLDVGYERDRLLPEANQDTSQVVEKVRSLVYDAVQGHSLDLRRAVENHPALAGVRLLRDGMMRQEPLMILGRFFIGDQAGVFVLDVAFNRVSVTLCHLGVRQKLLLQHPQPCLRHAPVVRQRPLRVLPPWDSDVEFPSFLMQSVAHVSQRLLVIDRHRWFAASGIQEVDLPHPLELELKRVRLRKVDGRHPRC